MKIGSKFGLALWKGNSVAAFGWKAKELTHESFSFANMKKLGHICFYFCFPTHCQPNV
jgi:hypothetical protein